MQWQNLSYSLLLPLFKINIEIGRCHPAPMSVSPVAASRIYPLTVHLFCADRLTAKKTANAANVNFRIKFNVLL